MPPEVPTVQFVGKYGTEDALRFHHSGRGLDGDWWWAGLKHYTPGLKIPLQPCSKQYTKQNAHEWNDIKLDDVDPILDCDRLDIFYNL